MAGIVSKIYNRLALLNPRIEVKLRQFYWHNIGSLGKFNPNVSTSLVKNESDLSRINFDDIIEQLKEWGVKEGSLLIVHSSFDSLKATGLSPIEIISKLRQLIGDSGTLAMPVIRTYKDEPNASQKMSFSYKPPRCTYNPRRTPISSGILPMLLMRIPNAKISLHPLNPLCAVGPLAEEMMMGNIDGCNPSPHGINSAWYYCYKHNAIIIGLGTDLRHHNTIGHVAEEAFGDWKWPDKEWYNLRDFVVEVSKDNSINLTVKERKPFWGMLHQAELNRYRDLLKNNILKSKSFGPILLELENADELITYLRAHNKNGYPYFK